MTEAFESPKQRGHRASVARIAGNMLLVIGAIAIIWAFAVWRWGDPATGVYTRWQQHRLDQQFAVLQRRFESLPSAVPQGVAPAPSPAALGARRAAAKGAAQRLSASLMSGDPVGRIRVRRLGVHVVAVSGTDHDSLKLGPGIDRRTALPGEGRLVYIAGHRTTFGAPFAHIDRLRRGDLIELEMPYGTYVYRVTNWVIVAADDLSRLLSRGQEEIALQACHPRFSARQRYIVYGRPIAGPGMAAVS